MQQVIIEDKIAREKAFHNERFAEEHDARDVQDKYYDSIRGCFKDYYAQIETSIADKRSLEYGCSYGENVSKYAPKALDIKGIDISDSAVEIGQGKIDNLGYKNAALSVMNAEEPTFEDGAFDFIFGAGILHHLDLDKSISQISRMLAKDGRAVFMEPLGHNPVINMYRNATPEARTPDEHPLLVSDWKIFRKHFRRVSTKFYGLTTIGTTPLRNTPVHKFALGASELLDSAIFLVPGVRFLAWYVLIEFEK
ncbi:class I SAM-dependent methyltransferase [Hirschia litorea]|uniref:Class I SAM-dependent methyltransferase n=1 Tax=Hirschia litorea TaxID=1199156 RepID=A0ABW2IJD7_9PROT